jgi:hypothetical protein
MKTRVKTMENVSMDDVNALHFTTALVVRFNVRTIARIRTMLRAASVCLPTHVLVFHHIQAIIVV